jgi:hypothetical protein
MYLPYEVLREIIIYSDLKTIINSFSVCKEFYKLSQDVDYWSEKDNLYDIKIFKEIVTYKPTNDLEKLTEQVVKSDNMELIYLFDNIRRSLSLLDKEQTQKYVMLLTTSASSLYTFFHKFKYFKGKCFYMFKRGALKGEFCGRKTLSLCEFCVSCFFKIKRSVYDNSLFINFDSHNFIVMEGTLLEGRILRDIITNFVFYSNNETCTLRGKFNKGIIVPPSEEDKDIARAIYESIVIKYIIS